MKLQLLIAFVAAAAAAAVAAMTAPLVVSIDVDQETVSFVHNDQLIELLASERLSVLAHVFGERFSLIDPRGMSHISVNSTLAAALRTGRILAVGGAQLELVIKNPAVTSRPVVAPADACSCATGRATISSTASVVSATLALQDISGETWSIVASNGTMNTARVGTGVRSSLGADGTLWVNGSVVSTESVTGAQLNVAGDGTVQGKLTIGGGLTTTGDVSLTGGNLNAQTVSVGDATVSHDLIVTGKTTVGAVDIQSGSATTLTAHTLAATTATTDTLAATTSVTAPSVCAGTRCLDTLSFASSTYQVDGGTAKVHNLGPHLFCALSAVHPHGWTSFDIELTIVNGNWTVTTSAPQSDSAIMCFDFK